MNKAVLQSVEPTQTATIVPKRVLRGIAFDDITLRTESAWLVKGLLPLEGVAQIYGDYGTGKSFLALDIGHSVATGEPWRGEFKTKQRMVLYLAAEGHAGVSKRISALQKDRAGHAAMTLLGDQLDIRDPKGADLIIEQVRAWHEERFTECEPGLVVIDTFSQVCPGDQNGTEAIQPAIANLLRIASELHICVLIVHHSGKDASRGPRGSSALPAAMDTLIRVAGKSNPHTATVEKQKDGEDGQVFAFSLETIELGVDEDGDPITSCIMRHEDGPAKSAKGKLPPSAELALRALHDCIAEHGEIVPDMADNHGIRVETWRDACEARSLTPTDTPDARRKAFKRAGESLELHGRVGVRNGWVWV